MKSWMLAACAAAMLAWSATASAGIPVVRPMTCPIDGERFNFTTTASYSTFGQRPDGKPYGSWHFPLDLPECPRTGFVMFKESFTPAEIDRIRPLVDSDEFRALRPEVPYYRAYWVMTRLDEPVRERLWTLLSAAWQADPNPEQRRRYLSEFAEAASAATVDPQDVEGLALRARAANALRELGRFEEAAALLDPAPLQRFEQPLPGEDERGRENRTGWLGFIEGLRQVIARRDSGREPFDLVPRDYAILTCLEPVPGFHPEHLAFCRSAAAEVERARRRRASVGGF